MSSVLSTGQTSALVIGRADVHRQPRDRARLHSSGLARDAAHRSGSGDLETGLWMEARPMTSESDSMIDNTLLTGLFASTHSPDARAEFPIGNFIPAREEERMEIVIIISH